MPPASPAAITAAARLPHAARLLFTHPARLSPFCRPSCKSRHNCAVFCGRRSSKTDSAFNTGRPLFNISASWLKNTARSSSVSLHLVCHLPKVKAVFAFSRCKNVVAAHKSRRFALACRGTNAAEALACAVNCLPPVLLHRLHPFPKPLYSLLAAALPST